MLSSCASLHDSEMISRLLPNATMAVVRTESMKLIERFLDEDMVPGLSVALVDDQGPVWLEGFGMANNQTGDKADAETLFRTGSLSKPVTALAVMQLVQAGRIDLDAPLKGQLVGFSIRHHDNDPMPVTPRQLLSHRSGLPSDLRKGMYTNTPFTQVTSLLHDEYAAYHPDMVYSYSNLGYDLLGHLIQQRSGAMFADQLDKRLFGPLAMHSSGFGLSPVMSERMSAGHLDGQVRPPPPLRDTPALGLYSTAVDLGRLMTALLSHEIPEVPAPLLKQMWLPQTVDGQISLGVSPGLGWFIENHPQVGQRVRHGGSTLLFGAEMVLLPAQGLGVAVLANGAGSNRLARELAGAILSIAISAKGGMQNQPKTRLTEGEPSGYSTPSGGYATDLGLLMVDPEHPRLCACIIERILDLVRFEDGSLGLTQESIDDLPDGYRVLGDLRLRSREVNGMDVLVADRDGKEIMLGNRIEADPWESVWRKRLGSYRTINPDGDYSVKDLHLSEEGGVLCLQYRVPHLSQDLIRLPLQPVSSTEAVIQGFGRGRGETVQIVEINGKQCLRFSGFMGEPLNKD
ncbi:MAG: beta-lactamase family protein [Candidatus Thiodiazotropha sp. (ex Epidulcina cf. delphinae)]|nr:beta-lactamase family protein [Candidatus Thiodiazotropha sp. (ex Epidulcina cf. delphinae)]